MIGVDTNVLVRLFVEDDQRQTERALRFMKKRSGEDPAFVSSVVLAELYWVLDRFYGYDDAAIFETFDWLFESSNIVVEREELMMVALAVARKNKADLSDSIIAAIAAQEGALHTVTFDSPAAQRIPGMELLK